MARKDLHLRGSISGAVESLVFLLRRVDEELEHYPRLTRLEVARDEARAALDHVRNAQRQINIVQHGRADV